MFAAHEKLARILRVQPEALLNLEEKMEAVTDKKGIMEKISAENDILIKRTLEELGLPEAGLKAGEVYDALIARIEHMDKDLYNFLDRPVLSKVSGICGKLCETALFLNKPKAGFFIKKEKAVEFLKKEPPQKIINYLGYKSVEELIEREDIFEIYAAIRLFEDSNVVHVSDKINPEDDIKTIETELIFADLETVNKQKEPKGSSTPKEAFAAYEVVKKIKTKLDSGIPVRQMALSDEELTAIKPLNLLTIKPVVYVFNISEQQLQNKEETEKKIKEIINSDNYLYFCAKLELDIVALDSKDQKEYLSQYGLEETGLNRLIKKSYEILGLISFLTAGVIEARAWTIKKGWLAPQAAGTIHTDFEKKFIKADIVKYEDFVKCGGWVKAREQGLVQITGKVYVMKDGEVVEFKIGS